MKSLKITFALILVSAMIYSCQKPEMTNPVSNQTAPSSKGVYDSLTKLTDSIYTQNGLVLHKLKWAWWYIGAPAYILDTVVVLGGSLTSPLPSQPAYFKTNDVVYIKYCLTYHEVTWHNQSEWPWGDRDTIYTYGNSPCYPNPSHTPAY